jgi:hypothetical protein
VRLPRLERLVVRADDCTVAFLEGCAALRPSIPALRVVELQRCICDDDECEVVGCACTEELVEELRAAWPGLEVRRLEEED